LNQGFSKRATVYFKKNTDSQYHLDSECTKVLIEKCDKCIVKLNARVLTQTVEAWHCDDTTIIINVPIKTLQLDMCKNLTVHFAKKEFFDSVVWAGLHNFTLKVGDDELCSGVEQVQSTVEDLKENFDQFIVRYVDGKLLQELIVRLQNGFPTTDREADAFDEQQKKNDKLFEEHVRKFMDSQFVEKKLEEVTKVDDPPADSEEKEPKKEEEEPEEEGK